MNEIRIEEDFYQEIALLLGCDEHCYKQYPYTKRTRWNNRNPGNGRYPGFGIIRRYNSNNISVNLHTPHVVGQFSSETSVLDAIKIALDIA